MVRTIVCIRLQLQSGIYYGKAAGNLTCAIDRVPFDLRIIIQQYQHIKDFNHNAKCVVKDTRIHRGLLSEHCISVTGTDTWQHLCVPPTVIFLQYRGLCSVVGSRVWNSLPDFVRDPTISADCFRLKCICLLDTSASSALGVLDDNYAIYLLTYLLTALVLRAKTKAKHCSAYHVFHVGRSFSGAQLVVMVDNLLDLLRGEATAAARRTSIIVVLNHSPLLKKHRTVCIHLDKRRHLIVYSKLIDCGKTTGTTPSSAKAEE